MTTRNTRGKREFGALEPLYSTARPFPSPSPDGEGKRKGGGQANRLISTGLLRTLPSLHSRPINVVVFHEPVGNPSFEEGFALRCFQRLSVPDMATLHCR